MRELFNYLKYKCHAAHGNFPFIISHLLASWFLDFKHEIHFPFHVALCISNNISRLTKKILTNTRYLAIQMKAIEQYFRMVLLIKLYKVFIICEYVNRNVVCDHSNESFHVVLFVVQYCF